MSIKIENLSFIYMEGTPFEKKAIDNISLNIKDGEFIALIGHTGCGKSTLVQNINGLLKPSEGNILIDGVNINEKGVKKINIRRKVGLVFQYPEYQLFEDTVEKDISFGPRSLGLANEEIKSRIKKAMSVVELDYEIYKDQSPFELSGGQKRRVAIAGIVAMEPNILILDEPTAGLDPEGRERILTQISRLHKEYKVTIIFVSHSMEDVAKVASRILVMEKGHIILDGTPGQVFKEVDILEKVGLAAPQISYLVQKLKKKGIELAPDTFTVIDARNQILNLLRGQGHD